MPQSCNVTLTTTPQSALEISTRPARRKFTSIFSLRFSPEQMHGLTHAAQVTPGCSTVVGVVRLAVDEWLEKHCPEAVKQHSCIH